VLVMDCDLADTALLLRRSLYPAASIAAAASLAVRCCCSCCSCRCFNVALLSRFVSLPPLCALLRGVAEGVIVTKKDHTMTKHPQIEVPNLHVCKLMQSLRSREVVKEKFNWCVDRDTHSSDNRTRMQAHSQLRLPGNAAALANAESLAAALCGPHAVCGDAAAGQDLAAMRCSCYVAGF